MSDDRWKVCLAAAEDRKEGISIALMIREQFFFSVLFKDHSGNNLIDPTLQNNVVIGTGIFHYIYHIGCAFNLHSIINNGLELGGQDSKQKTDNIFFAY